jgi:arylsulfatase A-like enzyme
MNRFLPLFLVCAAAVAPARAETVAPARRPNLILILADDLGYGDLGCFGQSRFKTPHLDSLARDGMRFTRMYAGSTVCAPSRSVLMTGLHTGHTPVRGNAGKGNRDAQCLRPGDATLASVLSQSGYATALVGKWGLGREGGPGLPTRHGFDTFVGYLDQHHAHNPHPPFWVRGEKRENLRNRPAANVPAEMWADGAGWSTNRVDYTPDLLADEALRWVEKQSEHPFFLFWSLITPHANNEATRGAGNGQEVPDLGAYRERDWPEPDRGFAATVARLDADVGRMLALLDRKGIAGDTLVLFTSDNGPHQEGGNRPEFFDSNGPLNGLKRSLTDGGIRVPALARWPGRIPAGRDCGTPVWFADLLPTFADLARAPPPAPPLDGTSLRPLFLGAEAPSAPRTFYWEFHEGGFSQAVLLDGRWKAIRLKRLDAPIAVHDLETDVGESIDLAATRPDLVARARDAFTALRADSTDWPIREANAGPRK